MKAKELMLGDWVFYNGKPTQITGIMPNEVYVSVSENTVDVGDIKSISLTDEILEKNGFGFKEYDKVWMKDGYDILRHYYLGEPCYCSNMNLHIGNMRETYWVNYHDQTVYRVRCVHELQHAFNLFGIELELKV